MPCAASWARIGLHDGRRGRHRIELAAVGLEQDRPVDADRHGVAQLLLGGRRAQRQHGRRPTLRLDDPDGFLDRALLVRADREAEVAGVDRLPVGRQDDPAAGRGDALDADEDLHATSAQLRIRALSGSNNGVAPATATVTG